MASSRFSKFVLPCATALVLLGLPQTGELHAESSAPASTSEESGKSSSFDRNVDEVGKKASELGDSIGKTADEAAESAATEAESAYEWSKRKGTEAYEWTKKQIHNLTQ